MSHDPVHYKPKASPLSRREFLRRMFVDTCTLSLAAYGFQSNAAQAQTQALPTFAAPALASRRMSNSSPSIAEENQLPGTNEWELRQFQNDIEGFASATSINQGETIDLYVNTNASAFDIAIYRSGYYGGAGGRLIKKIENLKGIVQPDGYTDRTTGLASFSTWSPCYHLETDSSWVSGIYIAKLLRRDTGGENQIFFVVRDDARGATILYQQSVTTYHAYNNYGGKSLYNFNSSSYTTISEERRAVKVALKRPYTGLSDTLVNDRYVNVEYPLVSWLESQGYDVSYSTSMDTHFAGKSGANNSLIKHKVFISAGHDEYWSQEMRDAVTAARDAGVHICFFGSNTCYWRIRFEPDPATQEPDTVIVCYKTAQSGPADPSGHATSTWRDSVSVNTPENGLVGLQYIGDHDSFFFPWRVSAELAQHRLYRNTGLEHLPPGSYVDIGQNLIGWEWDAVVDNGHTPPNLTIVAASPVFGELLQDNGRVYDLRQATVHTTCYTAQSGALVFASGTNHWSWGLAVVEPDVRIQQITYNLLADMHVQPATPTATLVLDNASSIPARPIETPLTAVHTVPPAIAKLQATPGDTTTTFNWTTDIITKGQIWLGITADQVNIAPYDYELQFSKTHEITLMSLEPETLYYYRAVVMDEHRQVVFSSVQQFQTQRGSLIVQAKTLARHLAATPLAWWLEENARVGITVAGSAVAAAGIGWIMRRFARTAATSSTATSATSNIEAEQKE
jgi:hypothetical protein